MPTSTLIASGTQQSGPSELWAPWIDPPSTPGRIWYAQVHPVVFDFTRFTQVTVQGDLVWYKPALGYVFWITDNGYYGPAVPIEYGGVVHFAPSERVVAIYITPRLGIEYIAELWGDAPPP